MRACVGVGVGGEWGCEIISNTGTGCKGGGRGRIKLFVTCRFWDKMSQWIKNGLERSKVPFVLLCLDPYCLI